MKRPYYIFKNGELKRKDNSLIMTSENDESKYIPVEDVDSIYIFGEIQSKYIWFIISTVNRNIIS